MVYGNGFSRKNVRLSWTHSTPLNDDKDATVEDAPDEDATDEDATDDSGASPLVHQLW